MPYSAKQRRAAFAELGRRKSDGGGKMFSGMSESDLTDYAHSPMEEKGMKKMKKKHMRISAGDQARALRKGGR